MYVQERYSPVVVPANGTVDFPADATGGFLCIVSGTITIYKLGSGVLNQGTLIPIVSSLPVTAGIYYPIPFHLGHLGGRIVAAGGAAGVLGTS